MHIHTPGTLDQCQRFHGPVWFLHFHDHRCLSVSLRHPSSTREGVLATCFLFELIIFPTHSQFSRTPARYDHHFPTNPHSFLSPGIKRHETQTSDTDETGHGKHDETEKKNPCSLHEQFLARFFLCSDCCSMFFVPLLFPNRNQSKIACKTNPRQLLA